MDRRDDLTVVCITDFFPCERHSVCSLCHRKLVSQQMIRKKNEKEDKRMK